MSKRSRALAQFLKKHPGQRPIVPGSGYTQGQLHKDSGSAVTLRYGQADRQARQNVRTSRQMESDTGDFYQAYLADLAKHQENTAAYQKGANDQLSKISGALGQLGPDTGALATSGEAQQATQNAAGIRQLLQGSFGAMVSSQGANANTYASNQAHVVGPGQKLQAQAEAQGRTRKAGVSLNDLLREKGAYRSQFESDAKQTESKNVMAAQALGLDIDQANTDKLYKGGYDPVTGKKMPAEKKPSPDTAPMASKAAQYGYSLKEWRNMTPAQRQKIITKFGPKGRPKAGEDVEPATAYARRFYEKYGIKPVSTAKIGASQGAIRDAQSWLKKLDGTKGANDKPLTLGEIGELLANGQAGSKDSAKVPKIDRLMVRVAMDLKENDGYISNGTADRLHRAGYSVRVLGLKTRPKPKPAHNSPSERAPGGT